MNNPKSVVISAGSLGPGGVETQVRILSQVLRDTDITVFIAGTNCHWRPETVKELKQSGVRFLAPPRWFVVSPKLRVLLAALLWRLCVPSNVSTLYAIGAGNSHAFLKRLLGPDVFSIYHEIVSPPGVGSPAANCLRLMDAAVANSRHVAKEMAAICPRKPIQVIPFLTAERPLPPPAARTPVGGRPLNVGYLGRLEERKRPHILVREWARLTSANGLASAILHIHGDDFGSGLRKRMLADTDASGLSDRVRFHGGYRHHEVSEILSRMDLIVLPSEWEGLPLVLVEAMQHGVPFVATAAGGTAELGSENPDVIVTGLEWSAFEVGLLEMAQRLRSGQVDSQRLHRWVESRYGFEAVARQWRDAILNSRNFFGVS